MWARYLEIVPKQRQDNTKIDPDLSMSEDECD